MSHRVCSSHSSHTAPLGYIKVSQCLWKRFLSPAAAKVAWVLPSPEPSRSRVTMSSPLRNPAKAGLLAGEHGTNMDVLPFDTTSKESIDACLETVMQKTGGKLYILVNNAGFGTTMPLLHASIEAAKAIYDVNVWGTLSLAQALSPLLLKSKGVIMNICSVVGAANVAWQGIYNSSKAAETMISESLRIELEPLGIRVMTVMLGQVSTQMYANTPAFHLPEGSPYEKVAGTITSSSGGGT
ncbi:hypothetical protein FJTKL_12801 [Diaporthe vaccinii]|uniref:Uncharacterized protein n=1 Tax=Diaporthe vaccinii TaxID=105482 RepID=A0ABR4F9L9_9PEZI